MCFYWFDFSPSPLCYPSPFPSPLVCSVRDVCRPGVSDNILDAALSGASSLATILEMMKMRE